MSLDLGSVVGGRYHLTRHIASGGMGRVWEARDEVLDRTVAVKVLHPQYSQDEEFVERFRSEARLTAKVQHANVAAVYDYGEMQENGHPLSYLVMEFVRGEALSDVLKRTHRLPERHTLDMLEQTARALQAAHEIGLVHRDVKPGNILITPAGQVKLTDFGIAKAMGGAAVTQTGMIIGTAHYIAPEQAVGKDATPAGDVYSLAVVGYECLAGKRPFNADSPLAIAMSHVKDEPPPLPADVPDNIRELLGYAMAKDPAVRYRNGAEFAKAVAAVKAGRRPVPPQGYRSEGERTETITAPGAAAAAGAAGAGAGLAAGAALANAQTPRTQTMPTTAPGTAQSAAHTAAQRNPHTGNPNTHFAPAQQGPPQHAAYSRSSAPRGSGSRASGNGWIWALAALLFLIAIGAAVALLVTQDDSPTTPAPSTSSTPSTPSSQAPQTTEQAPPPAPSTEPNRSLGEQLSSLTSEFVSPSSEPNTPPDNNGNGNGNATSGGNNDNSGNPGNSGNTGNPGNPSNDGANTPGGAAAESGASDNNAAAQGSPAQAGAAAFFPAPRGG